MKRIRRKWKTMSVCAALVLALLITACGGSSSGSSSGGSGGNAGSTGSAAKTAGAGTADSETEKEGNSAPGVSSGAVGGVVYDANDIEIKLTDISEEEESYLFLDFDITNKGSKSLQVQLYPLVVNDALGISEGIFSDLDPGATVQEEAYIDMGPVKFAGISSAEKVDGYVVISDRDNNYTPIGEPERITILAGGQGGDAPAHSDQVIYDTDGICVSYLGSFKDEHDGNEAVFFVTNQTEDVVSISTPYREESIDGKPAGDSYMNFEGATVMPGDCALATACVLNAETYQAAPFTSLDMELQVNMDNDHWIPEQIPCHLKLEGGQLALTADAPYIAEEMQEVKEYFEEQQKEEEHEAEVAANAEEVKDPEIAKTGIYNYTVGTSYSNAIITALVHNPNERTALYHVKLECKAYDADNNLLDEPKLLYYYNEFTILPGEDVPFEFDVNRIDIGKEVDHVELTLAGFDSVNMLDLDNTASTYSLEIPAADIHLDNVAVEEGGKDEEAVFGRRGAYLTGTLVNDGDPGEMVYILYTLYDQDGEIILCGRKLESELPSGETPDYYHEFGPAVYELPGYDHIDITCYKRAQ